MTRISAIIPTYNRRGLLCRCLKSLAGQTLDPRLYEIIVADDEDSIQTAMLVENMRGIFSSHRLVYAPVTGKHGPAAARNRGWKMAGGEIIAFIDDDCVADARWLQEGLSAFTPEVDAAWGCLKMPLPGRPTDYEWSASQLSRAVFVTANCFCRRQVLEETGGFDERFQKAWREDSDLHFTLIERRKNIVPAPQAIVEHPVRPAAFGICLKQQKNNFYEALLFKKHPGLYRRFISSGCMIYYYAAVISFVLWIMALWSKNRLLAGTAAFIWAPLFMAFFVKRIYRTSKSPGHIFEMALTSFLIPPLSIVWRLAGAWTFRVPFI